MATLELRNIGKRFGESWAVKDVSFEVGDGELFVLVGPSGCGKSTLLNIIAGLESCSDGEVLIGGESVTALDPRRRNIAMVFQNYAIYPHMSVRENMAFPLEIARVPKPEIHRRVAEVAETLELSELLDRRPRALSGGQRQRVAMGRAMVREPGLFLLDEPLSNLDAQLRTRMRIEIARLQRRLGTTMVYVTHDQTEALTIADRLAVLHEGTLLQLGSPQELYARPRSLFVAGFIGTPAMNFVPARFDGRELELELGIGRFEPPERCRKRIEASRGPLAVGFRAEHLEASATDPRDAQALGFEARVEVSEWLGADLYVHVVPHTQDEIRSAEALPESARVDAVNEGTLVARLSPQLAIREGDTIGLRLRARDAMVFDAGTGENLSIED
jgi:multiple sugar transport system ATP-binding protein